MKGHVNPRGPPDIDRWLDTELSHIDSKLAQFHGKNEPHNVQIAAEMKEAFTRFSLGRNMTAAYENALIIAAGDPTAPLKPLVNVRNGEVIHTFPRNIEELDRMSIIHCMVVLLALYHNAHPTFEDDMRRRVQNAISM